MTYKKAVLNMLSILLAIGMLTACLIPQSTQFSAESFDAAQEVRNLLIKRGICENITKQCGGHIFTTRETYGGFVFSTYGIQDTRLLEEIKSIILKKFYETPKMGHVIIEAYVGKGKPTLGSFPDKSKVIYQLKFIK